MSDQDNRAPKAPHKTVLAASGAFSQQQTDATATGPQASVDGEPLGVADTFVATGGVDPSGRPRPVPPASRATVMGASGAAEALQGKARLPITAPEISGAPDDPLSGVSMLPSLDPEALVGTVVADRYRILKMLGQGGMGVVYLAEHVVIEKRVALKILNEELTHSRDAVSRFIYEAKAASKIGHENIIDINDFGTTPVGGVFFVMEFLDGTDLSDYLKAEGRISWEKCRRIGIQVCRALAAAHGKGIIHRDLKPENIFLIRQGGRDDFVKILDFGIAKFTGLEGGAPKQTKTGMIFGTPDYMAPEQAEARKADHRVDIYSLGIILYQLVTGRLPFEAETFMGVLHQHMTKIPTPPRELEPSLPSSFDAIIRRSLEKDPDNRFQTMQELCAALEELPAEASEPQHAPAPEAELLLHPRRSSGPDTALVPGPPPLVQPEIRKARPTALLWGLMALGAALLAGVGVLFWGGNPRHGTAPGDRPAARLDGGHPQDAQARRSVPDAKVPPDARAAARFVKIQVMTRPSGAEVLLDGSTIGHTPLKDHSIPSGEKERVLLLRKPGYRSLEIRFVPDSNLSCERILEKGRGLTRVSPERPPPRDEPRPPPSGDGPRIAPPMDHRPPPPKDPMDPMGSDLKDPF